MNEAPAMIIIIADLRVTGHSVLTVGAEHLDQGQEESRLMI